MSKVSFVIPCYRSARTIEGVVAEIQSTMASMPEYTCEIILVNDCSPDDTYEVIKNLCARYSCITGISLAKNFGQHAALMAGLRMRSESCLSALSAEVMWFTQAMGIRSTAPFAILAHG